MRDWLNVLKVTIGLFLVSMVYVFLEKGMSLDMFVKGVKFIPFAFSLIAAYYFYNKNR